MSDWTIEELVTRADEAGGSDIHLVYGLPPKMRVDGRLQNLVNTPLTDEDCESVAEHLAGDDYSGIARIGELDLARTLAGRRCRINLFRQQGHVSCALRILADEIPKLSNLGLPRAVAKFPTYANGIVLVTGETGSGKSTTLAAIINEINHTRQEHIITLEDPIEYIYKPDQCIINQRQVGTDTESYADGLRAILREDPDIILIGEMRDRETIETALTAAETGHLVFATLHTNSAVDSVDRIVGTFPADRQPQIRLQLSTTLKATLSQKLLVRAGGKGRAAACECMIVTAAIRNLIREGKTPQMESSMMTGSSEGSITLDNCLLELAGNGTIDIQTAVDAARDPENLKRRLGGVSGGAFRGPRI
jgi:twitching motility protein PilT